MAIFFIHASYKEVPVKKSYSLQAFREQKERILKGMHLLSQYAQELVSKTSEVALVSLISPGENMIPVLSGHFPHSDCAYFSPRFDEKCPTPSFYWGEIPQLAKKTVIIAAYSIYNIEGLVKTLEVVESFCPDRIIVLNMVCSPPIIEKMCEYDKEFEITTVMVE